MRTFGMLACALLVVTTGCTTSRVGDFTAIANHSIGHPEAIQLGVTGDDCVIRFALGQYPSLEKAIDNAVRSVPGANALVNVEIDFYTNPFKAILYPNLCYKVRGDAVRIRNISQ